MAMDPDGLGTAIWNALVSNGYATAKEGNHGEDIWQLICGYIVEHIQDNAEVSTTVASGIACQVDPYQHVGATTGTGSGTGTIS